MRTLLVAPLALVLWLVSVVLSLLAAGLHGLSSLADRGALGLLRGPYYAIVVVRRRLEGRPRWLTRDLGMLGIHSPTCPYRTGEFSPTPGGYRPCTCPETDAPPQAPLPA